MITYIVGQLIDLYHSKKRPLLVALCGAADVGKSTMARTIVEKLLENRFTADHVSFDTFLLDRQTRLLLGISGYDIGAHDIDTAARSIGNMLRGQPFHYFEYDHVTGRNRTEGRIINRPQIMLVEGLHTFHEQIMPYLDYKIFIQGSKDVLNALRHTHNVHKRNMSPSIAAENLEREYALYESQVLPYCRYADLCVRVTEQWQYSI